jgi:tetratricopeptide (TPR) repeat protein
MRTLALLPWLALLLALTACRSHPFGEIDRSNALAHLDVAEVDVRAGEFERALAHLAEVHQVNGLDPDLRAREQRLIDAAAAGRFAQLADGTADELEDLFDSELPERVRARAGILAANRMLAEGSRISAFRMVKKVDQELPGHPERVLAGDVLARAGLALVEDDGRYRLLLHYWPRGVQTLEYLVIHYPLEPRCAEAYFALSERYEREGEISQAIERTEDLLLYHPGSAYATAAGARLPYLRLVRLSRDDYDRTELLRAHSELGLWLARNPRHELAPWARELVRECEARLVRSDLYLATFYERTETPAGIRIHATRALELSRELGLAAEAAAAQSLLEDLPGTAALAPLPATEGEP